MDSIPRQFPIFCLTCCALYITVGCQPKLTVRAVEEELTTRSKHPSVIVSADLDWADSGFDISSGEVIHFRASGEIFPGKSVTLGRKEAIGPEGTFFYSDKIADKPFPLPAASSGPAPCFGLIGRIGDGPVFPVGDQLSRSMTHSGRLYLGVNDFDHADNRGQFEVIVERGSRPQPVRYEEPIEEELAARAIPLVKDARVIVFYMDGLRPDVVQEMSAMGHLPTLTKLFLEGGTWLSESYTGFPSDTITSNGTMWTGCFSDRHGLKGQVRFSRRSLISESYLEPLGPNRSSRLLKPQGVDKLIQDAQVGTYNLVPGEEAGDRWRESQVSDVPPLYQHLKSQGDDWATGILPMMTEVPPMLWTRSLIRNMPYFRAQEAWNYIDDANTHFAVKHLIARDLPVTIIWLPETDTVSHKQSRGQFGSTRRTIALADRLIGKVVHTLETRGMLDNTYFMLVSDHGHHGGRDAYLTHFDLANDLFHRPRQVDQEGNWNGGGLGLSVRQHRFWNRHPADSTREFVFIDGDTDGAARIYLPTGHYRSNDWMGGSRPADLLQYKINPQLAPMNLPATIAATQGRDGRGEWEHPIDLVMMGLSDSSMLVTTHDRGQAVIDRRRNSDNRWSYRYRVVENVRPQADGAVAFDEISQPSIDPLGLVNVVPSHEWGQYRNEREWLKITARTEYPDSVVALTRHMLWQENLEYREAEYSPDLVVTARPNWYFGTKSSPGTMHGYPFRESMRATWFVSGPTIRRGAKLSQPVRLADLTPTILHLVGFQDDEVEFDGRIVTEIFRTDRTTSKPREDSPVYWQDVDLAAWSSLTYQPAEPYEHLPSTVNRPERGFDLNNIAYNLVAIGDISVWRIFDDVVSPLTGGEDYLTNFIEQVEQQSWKLGKPVGEAVEVIDVSGLTVADYSQTSIGHLQRANRAVDWVQARTSEADRAIVTPIGFEQSAPLAWTNEAIDTSQMAFWESYRFVHRIAIQLLDETLLNGLENSADRGVNAFDKIPAEQKVIRVVTPATAGALN